MWKISRWTLPVVPSSLLLVVVPWATSISNQEQMEPQEDSVNNTVVKFYHNFWSTVKSTIGGDFNCILDKEDCTRYRDSKMSPSLKRLVRTFSLKDSFRTIHPEVKTYSRFYERNGEGASRIDRSYNWGNIRVLEASYIAVAFSDHLGYVVKI